MNGRTLRALLLDAFYQVLDDKVFRILLVVAAALIVPSFVVVFGHDRINVLFGVWTIEYENFFRTLQRAVPAEPDRPLAAVSLVQRFVVDSLAGTLGVLFSIAATAFFVPRMLEKGAADTLFSKPLGRSVLLLARYATSILFVATLAFVLVFGMHVGFLIVSGVSDPAFLWSVLTITYVFALVQSVSILVAVLTRSSVAAMLCTLLFFVANGCVHQFHAFGAQMRARQEQRGEDEGGRESGGMLAVLDALYVPHLVLPKTSDAEILVTKLRRAVTEEAPVLRDTTGNLLVGEDPPGFTRQGPRAVDLGSSSAVWTGPVDARIEIARSPRPTVVDSKGRARHRSSDAVASDFEKESGKRTDLADKPVRDRFMSQGHPTFAWVDVHEKRDGNTRTVRRGFVEFGDWLYTIDVAAGTAASGAATVRTAESIFEELALTIRPERPDVSSMRPDEWYASQLTWDGPIASNIGFSIGSSIAFAVILLVLAYWRLAKIDF